MDEIKELRNQLTSLPQHSLPEEKRKPSYDTWLDLRKNRTEKSGLLHCCLPLELQ